MTSKNPIKVFISYAKEDTSFMHELTKHLKVFEKNNIIEIWHDALIAPGENWKEEIKVHIQDAHVIILLISADFMASDYIDNIEISKSLDRSRKRETVIIPIIIRPTNYSSLEISKYQALPKDGKPVSTWVDKDEAWVDITNQLKKLFDSLSEGKIKLEESKIFNVNKSNIERPPDSIIQIKKLIGEGKLKKALEVSLEILKASQEDDLYNSLLLLSSRYNSLQRNETMGIISATESSKSKNQITYSLLSILSEIEKHPV